MISPHTNGESKTLEEFFARIGKLTKYAITFGQKYRHEPHPALGMDARLPDGYMTLWAESEIAARQWLVANIGNAYCSIDDEAHFVAEAAAHYPLGRLGDVRGRVAMLDLSINSLDDDDEDETWVNEHGWDFTPGQPPSRRW